MREDKWGVIERFRVRDEWRERVSREHPGLLERQMARRGTLVAEHVHVLGPFLLPWNDQVWLTVLWQFPDRDAATPLRSLWDDPAWRECVETEIHEGPKYDPSDSLPGFAPPSE